MRDAVVPDTVVAALLEVDADQRRTIAPERVRQTLDRWEAPHRVGAPPRVSRERAAFAYAGRRLAEACERAPAGVEDIGALRAYVAWLEAMRNVWGAENACLDWVPYEDPFGSIADEIAYARARVDKLTQAEQLQATERELAERARRETRFAELRLRRTQTADVQGLNADEYRDTILAHAPPEQRDALATALAEMEAEDRRALVAANRERASGDAAEVVASGCDQRAGGKRRPAAVAKGWRESQAHADPTMRVSSRA
jgi:hypothetical protein